MAKVVNDTDKLTFILTNWGLERVASALEDPEVVIMLNKIKIGDANYEYYEPNSDIEELKSPIENGEFYIIEKDLLEDQLTISLHAIMPEDSNNYEIREVGVYENYNGEDKLFAISTQQPLLKPSSELRYFISVDYYAFLKSANLAEIYDQIYIDPDNQMITQEDFDELIRTILFTESNMMEQINGNSRVIGLNRAQQLYDKIEDNKNTFSYVANCNNYSLLLAGLQDKNDIFAYWLFNYPRKTVSATSITDISGFGRNLNTSKNINLFNKKYIGLMPLLCMTDEDYFYMSQNDIVTEFNSEIFTVEGSPIITSNGMASGFSNDNYVTLPNITRTLNDDYTTTFNFQLNTNYVSQSIAYWSTPYSMEAYYDSATSSFVMQLGDGSEWIETLSFEIEAGGSYTVRLIFNDDEYSLGLMNGNDYEEKVRGAMTFLLPMNLGMLTLGKNYGTHQAFIDTMNLSKVAATENGNTLYSGLTSNAVNNLVFLSDDGLSDISFSMLFALEPREIGVNRTLIARSNYSTNSFIFEVTETAQNALRVRLFYDSSNYVTFESGTNSLPIEAHALSLCYNAPVQKMSAYVNGKKLSMSRVVTGYYPHMSNPISVLYSYTYTEEHKIYADSPTDPTALFNADGSPYTGSEWSVSNSVVFYGDESAAYNSTTIQTPTLYRWVWNDGLDDWVIYTKTQNIEADTVLYNEDYTVYTGTDFAVVQSGTAYVVVYLNNATDYDGEKAPETLYCYKFSYPMEIIWANSSSAPSVLYLANGDIYSGSAWRIQNSNVIYTRDGGTAQYTSIYNIPVSTLPVTSYVIGTSGEIEAPINSNVGVIGVAKELITDEELKTLSLNLSAALGNNPCIKEY